MCFKFIVFKTLNISMHNANYNDILLYQQLIFKLIKLKMTK